MKGKNSHLNLLGGSKKARKSSIVENNERYYMQGEKGEKVHEIGERNLNARGRTAWPKGGGGGKQK